MAEYIRRSLAEEAIEEYICRRCEEYNELAGGCISHAMHCPYLSGEEILKPVENEDVQPVDRWISVEDRLPEDDGDCLVWYRCDTVFGKSESWGIAHCSRCDWYTKHLDGDNIVVLYWQSMPEPPETTKG